MSNADSDFRQNEQVRTEVGTSQLVLRRTAGGGALPQGRVQGNRAQRLRRLAWATVLFSPALFGAAYFGAVATNQYVSEAQFVVRSASKPGRILGGLESLLEVAGISRPRDDVWAVHDYLTSRDAVRALSRRLDLRAIYGHPAADFLARYPSILHNGSEEQLYRYFQHRLTVVVNSSTNLTTLRVDAFTAQDAQRVAEALLELGETLVNKLNERAEADAVRVAEAEVARAEARRIAAEQAITAFRDRELLLDPAQNSAIMVEVIGNLSSQLADARADLDQMRATSPTNPGVPVLERKVQALERQLAAERGRVGDAGDGLAGKVAAYEKLNLEREFSIRALSGAVAALEQARTEARRQQVFLERVVEPGLPDYPMMPRRWRMVLTVFGFNVLGVAVGWLLLTGVREHAGAMRE